MTALNAGTWKIDPAHSEIGFTVRHLVSKVRGKFTEFDGTVVSDGEVETARVTGSVQAASITTGAGQRDDHLRTSDFFEVEAHPELTFASTGVTAGDDGYELAGDLTIKGVTRPVVFAVDFGGIAKDAYGHTVAGIDATVKIKREDFGWAWNAAVETGGMLVGSDVTIHIAAEFQLQG